MSIFAFCVLLLTPQVADAARPMPGACYGGVFHKQRMLAPRSLWLLSSSHDNYAGFQLITTPDGRRFTHAALAWFSWGEASPDAAPNDEEIDLFAGSRRGRIDANGVFGGAAHDMLFHHADFTQFKGQFLSDGRVIFRYRSHFWVAPGGPGMKTGWVTARGRVGHPECQDNQIPDNGP